MNRVGLGLAIGAGYVLGRTKKMKLAVAVGSMVAGKRLNLTPKGVADLVSQQLRDNPQFKEIGDQLRQDLRGVGKAASGAMVERQMSTLADRLHGRTSQVRDQLQGVVPDVTGKKPRKDDEADEADEEYEEPESAQDEGEGDEGADTDEGAGAGERTEGDEADEGDETDEGEERAEADQSGKADQSDEEPAPKRPMAKKASAKKAAKKAHNRGTAAKRATAVRKTMTKTASRARGPKGGGE
ncbi:DNA primase [Streptomyces sp. NPDC051315]|uniref:DNA primase n=1 Tax=Streptomyces sp. NPDC051315 TaxID=3365650 RepID=UPI00378CEC80